MSVSLGEDDLFVGRGAELSRLEDCARQVRAARPWVVLVEGPPGAGKPALLRHWLSREDREDVTLLRAYGDAAEAESSFGLVGQLIARMSAEQLHGFPPCGTAFHLLPPHALRSLDSYCDFSTSGSWPWTENGAVNWFSAGWTRTRWPSSCTAPPESSPACP